MVLLQLKVSVSEYTIWLYFDFKGVVTDIPYHL